MTDETTAVDDELLTVRQVATLLKASPRYVYSEVAAGRMRGINLSPGSKRSSIRVRRSSVAAFLSEREAS